MNAPCIVDRVSSIRDATLFAQQRSEIDAFFNQYIPANRPIALLQFPFDPNVGNYMMWLAISDYLKRRGVRVAYAAHEYNFRLRNLQEAAGDGPILFLGGVTVSRLWPSHAKMKRTVAAACPDNRLISLPSTMLFVDDEDRREASSMFGDHRNVVMMARDPVSAKSAREAFPDNVTVAAIHDSAFRLPQQPRLSAPTQDIIWLARDDHESTGATAPSDVQVFDWADVRHVGHLGVDRVLSRLRISAPMLSPLVNAQVNTSYDWISRYVLARGNRTLDAAKVLVTDRVHPHVLAALRSQPCVLLPDRYGKNRAVYEYSSRNYSSIHWADTPRQALGLARELAASSRPAAATASRADPIGALGAIWQEAQVSPHQIEVLQHLADAAARLALVA